MPTGTLRRPFAGLVAVAAAFAAALPLAACGEATVVDSTPEASTPASPLPATATPAPGPGSVVVKPGQELRLGVSVSLSGPTASLGQDVRDAVVLAVEDFGQHILGFPLAVAAVDDGCTDAERAMAAANELAADPMVVAVVGPMCSNGAQAANPVYERAALLHVSPSASMAVLTEAAAKHFLRTVWRDDRQGAALALYARDALGAGSAVTVDAGDSYGEAVVGGFVDRFQVGGTVAAREKIAMGQTDFTGIIERLLAAPPDVILFAGFPTEGAIFVPQLRYSGYAGTVLAPDSLFDATAFAAAAGPSADRVLVLAGPPPPDDLKASFRERFGREPRSPFVGHAYDAAMVLLTAVDAVAVEKDGQLIIDRSALLDAVRTRALTGHTGKIRFDERGDRAGLAPEEMGLALYVVRDGQFFVEGLEGRATPTPAASPTDTPVP